MKSRDSKKKPGKREHRRFCEALLQMKSVGECQRFMEDLCTPAELEAMVDRWRVVEMLKRDLTYREIAEQTGISVTTVGRVSRSLEMGNQGYQLAYSRLAERGKKVSR